MAMISPLPGAVNCRSLLTKSAGRVGGVFFSPLLQAHSRASASAGSRQSFLCMAATSVKIQLNYYTTELPA